MYTKKLLSDKQKFQRIPASLSLVVFDFTGPEPVSNIHVSYHIQHTRIGKNHLQCCIFYLEFRGHALACGRSAATGSCGSVDLLDVVGRTFNGEKSEPGHSSFAELTLG